MFTIRKMLRQNGPGKMMIITLICASLVFTTIMPVMASPGVQTGLSHSPPGYFVPGYRIQLDCNVSDPV